MNSYWYTWMVSDFTNPFRLIGVLHVVLSSNKNVSWVVRQLLHECSLNWSMFTIDLFLLPYSWIVSRFKLWLLLLDQLYLKNCQVKQGNDKIWIKNVKHDQMHVQQIQERQFHRINKSNAEIFPRNVILSESTKQHPQSPTLHYERKGKI